MRVNPVQQTLSGCLSGVSFTSGGGEGRTAPRFTATLGRVYDGGLVRWKREGQAALMSEDTRDFTVVLAEAATAIAAGEIFRVRPPIGTQDEELQQLASPGKFERI